MRLAQRRAGPARRTQSQPLFGPSIPLNVTGPETSQVQKTPRTATTAIRDATRDIFSCPPAVRGGSGHRPA